MAYENILFDRTGGIARLTLNRPDRLNSFNAAMHDEVRDAIERIRSDDSCRVLVLTGAGRGFCAGQDLGDRAVAPGGSGVDLGDSIEKRYKPLVLSLRSVAAAGHRGGQRRGGRRRREHRSRLRPGDRGALGELHSVVRQARLVPDSGGTWFLPRLVGTARAIGLAFLGDKLAPSRRRSGA